MTLNKSLVLLVVIGATVLVGAVPATAQQTTAEQATNQTTYELVVPGDPDTKVVSFDYANDMMELVIEADTPTPITLTAAPESTGETSTGTGYVQNQVISDGRTSMSIRSPNGVVWISTRDSVQAGKFGYVRASTSSFPIPGPWDAADARNAGLGAALSVSVVTLVLAWKRQFSDSPGGERIA